jgi:hypothetical protein
MASKGFLQHFSGGGKLSFPLHSNRIGLLLTVMAMREPKIHFHGK